MREEIALSAGMVAENPQAYLLILLGVHLLQCPVCVEAGEKQETQRIVECILAGREGQMLVEEGMVTFEYAEAVIRGHLRLFYDPVEIVNSEGPLF